MTRPVATVQDPLDRVLAGRGLLESLAAAAELTDAAARGAAPGGLAHAYARADGLARLLLLPVLAAATGSHEATRLLLAAIEGPDPAEREHAAWALAGVPPVPVAGPALAALRAEGGFPGMLAELALEPRRPGALRARPPRAARGRGLRIVQVFMQGWIDPGLTRAGAGDAGGIATLLVHLGAALAARPEVEEVVTLARGAGRAEWVAPGVRIERVPFGGDGPLASTDAWPHRRELERGLERALRRLGPVDAVHLRFADVASLAAARVCERLGLPFFFTLAPDPHALIHRRELAGALDRDSFVRADRREHLLFRARLVERLRDRATGLAVLPRAGARRELAELVGLADRHQLVHTVPEGIAIGALDAAAAAVASGADPVAAQLASAVAGLSPARHDLPLVLSVGRMHRVKGFAALLEAWAGDPALRDAANLVIVGGDLVHPSAEERSVLEALEAVRRRHPGAGDGLLLLGHRPHADVLRLMAAAQQGVAGTVAPGGIYACASEKEEFGLALLEAMGTGLSVMGPATGGPPTFIAEGVTGTLADTGSVAGVRAGLRRALALRLSGDLAERAAATVRERFTVEAMAAGLVDLYAAARPA
jgi:glycosyltransferase involved in cell wall biosynthesis